MRTAAALAFLLALPSIARAQNDIVSVHYVQKNPESSNDHSVEGLWASWELDVNKTDDSVKLVGHGRDGGTKLYTAKLSELVGREKVIGVRHDRLDDFPDYAEAVTPAENDRRKPAGILGTAKYNLTHNNSWAPWDMFLEVQTKDWTRKTAGQRSVWREVAGRDDQVAGTDWYGRTTVGGAVAANMTNRNNAEGRSVVAFLDAIGALKDKLIARGPDGEKATSGFIDLITPVGKPVKPAPAPAPAPPKKVAEPKPAERPKPRLPMPGE